MCPALLNLDLRGGQAGDKEKGVERRNGSSPPPFYYLFKLFRELSTSAPLNQAQSLVPGLSGGSALLSSFASAFRQDGRRFELHFASASGVPDNTLLPFQLNGHQGINQGLLLDVRMLANDADIPLKSLLGWGVQIDLASDDDEAPPLCGIITEVRLDGADGGFGHYRLRIEDGLSILRLRRGWRVFMDLSVLELTQTILGDHLRNNSILAEAMTLQVCCRKSYAEQPFWFQNGESDLDFLRRIWAKAGISYVIQPADGSSSDQPQHQVYLFDDVLDLPASPAGAVPFRQAGTTVPGSCIYQWQGMRQLQPGELQRGQFGEPGRAGQGPRFEPGGLPAPSLPGGQRPGHLPGSGPDPDAGP